MEWTKSDTLKFIELLQGHPCLWNPKHLEYKNRQKRQDAVINISQQMSTEEKVIDTKAVEKKVVSLKTQFGRELHKLKLKSGAGLEEVVQSSWYAFEHLYFLKDMNALVPSMDSIMVADHDQDSINKDNNEKQHASPQKSQSSRKLKHDATLNLLKDASNAIMKKQKKDDLSIFGEAIASELREIKSKRHLIILKREIMELVYKTKLEILDSD